MSNEPEDRLLLSLDIIRNRLVETICQIDKEWDYIEKCKKLKKKK